jgi:preprotein translocase subunit SecE
VKDKEQMTTAVTASAPSGAEDRPGKAIEPPQKHSLFQAHKPGEGYATRLGMMAVVMSYVGFACHHWFYNWIYLRNFLDSIHLGFLVSWTYELAAARYVAGVGAFAIAAVGFFIGYYYIYVKKASSEFLIKTDVELAKVTWPKITPWFKMDTQVWGATYVVLIVVAALTVYVFGIDMILQALANKLFYSHS